MLKNLFSPMHNENYLMKHFLLSCLIFLYPCQAWDIEGVQEVSCGGLLQIGFLLLVKFQAILFILMCTIGKLFQKLTAIFNSV